MTGPAPEAAAGSIPASVDALAAALIVLYATAEQDLLDSMATAARHGLRDEAAAGQAAMLAEMRRAAQRIATALRLRSEPLARRIAEEAAHRGDAAALAVLRSIVGGDSRLARFYLGRITTASGQGIAAANAIALDLAGKLDDVSRRILRFADDAYRAATAEAATRLVLGREGLTPSTAQRLAWRELTRLGVTGYADTTGRRWNLSSYVEVATRTAVQRAYNTAHQDRMTSVGIRYFTISHNGRPCPLCKPWEGAILSTGPTGIVREPSALDGHQVAFRVAGTLDEARTAGLQHPNCKHVLLPYLPGVTKTASSLRWTAVDEQRYQATQQLRALERRVRQLKREQAAALDELSRQRAARAVRATQTRIRAHVDQHGLNRRRRREQLDLGNR